MSQWFDQSNNANKLRQSYLKGFLDISGGGILVRSDNSLNFYKSDSGATPEFALDATKLKVKSGANNYSGWVNNAQAMPLTAGDFVDISAQKLGYLYNLTENVQSTIDEFHAYKNAATTGISSSTVDASNVTVAADASIGGRLYVGGDINARGNLTLDKNLYVGGNVVVAGSQTVNMDFYVKGNTHLDGHLYAGKDFYLYNGNAVVNQNITASGDLYIAGQSYFTGDVSMSANLRVTDTIFCNKIVIATDLSDAGTMEIAMDVSMHSRLFVADDASLNAKLFVSGDASLNSNLSARDVSAGMFQAGRLIIEDNHNGVGNMPNTIRSTEGNIVIKPNQPTDWTIITSNLKVDGSINFTGSMVRTDTIVKVTEAFDVSNAGSRTALMVSQNAPSYDIAAFDNGDGTAPTFLVGRDNCVAINKTSVTANRHLDVSGNGYLSGLFDVTGAVTFHNSLDVSANYLSTLGNITLTNGKLTTNTLEVSTTSTFVGNVQLNSHLKMDASKFIDQIGNEVW